MNSAYKVFFSYYSEEFGQFEDIGISVETENQFEARLKAWEIIDSDDNRKFMSCLRLCGVTWNASPVNMQEYLNAEAADYKRHMKIIENVVIPNAVIQNNEDSQARSRHELGYHLGGLDSVANIARNIGKPFGMPPPDLFDELHYADAFAVELEKSQNYEHAWLLSEIVEKARKWDRDAMFSNRRLFRDDYITLQGEVCLLSQYFAKDSVYPEKADISDREYRYTTRWENARHVDKLSRLPMFGEKDIIRGSESWNRQMSYEYRVLVINPNVLAKEMQRPENMLWTPVVEDDRIRYAQNIITNNYMNFARDDFFGVLRPEFENNIDFAALKYEYELSQDKSQADEDSFSLDTGIEDEGEAEDEFY